MSTTTTERPDVEAYLAAVRAELGDLKPDERDELLLEVEASIVDAAEETDAPIAARLGPPADFAAELRAAAGLAPGDPAPSRIALRELWSNPQVVAARNTLAELAPIWWIARAYVVVWALAWIVVPDQGSSVPAIARLGRPESVLTILALVAAASVAVGLWRRRRGGAATIGLALNLVLAGAAVPAYAGLADWLTGRGNSSSEYVVQTVATPGLARDGVPVENIYPYSRDGRLLLDVLLYDQNGASLDVRMLDSDPTRRVLRRKDGATIFNSFPVRYYEAGTRLVRRPGAAPPIDWSPVTTPPLRRPRAKP